jgi:nucleotide-binding universal stress UspA family protein
MSTTQSFSNERLTKLARPRLRSILAGIDGSPSADNALQLAAFIAERYSATVDLVHVDVMPSELVGKAARGALLHPITSGSNQSLIEKKELARTLVMEDEALLLDRKKSLASRKIKCHEVSVSSSSVDVGPEIVRICNDGRYDLVVVGNRGLSGVASFLPGSVSRKVATEAKCSVLISKININKIERILVPYDGSVGSYKALSFAADLGTKFHATVNVISVASTAMLSSEVTLTAAIQNLEEEMRNYSNEAALLLRQKGVISEGTKVVGAADVSRAIIDEAEAGFCDLIVLGNRGRGETKSVFLGGTASAVLFDSSRANILIVK